MSLIPWRSKQRESAQTESSALALLRGEMDRIFDAFVRGPFGAIDWPFAGHGNWSPAVDVAENDEEVTIRAELPGIDPEELDVSISGNQLVLSGEKKESTEESGKGFYHSESRFGAFRRSLPLPEGTDPQNIDAQYANGVLTIHLKKSPSAAPKRIAVKVKD